MAHPLYVDGVNISQYGTPAGASVGFDFVDGGQGGYMLDGSDKVDEMAKWAIITYPCMPLSETDLQALLSLVFVGAVHTITYYDPVRGDRTIRARRSISQPKERGKGADGKTYWTGIVLTFKEVHGNA